MPRAQLPNHTYYHAIWNSTYSSANEFVNQIKGDTLFLSIIAGLLSGVGIGVALRYGTSTGGIDIVAQAVNLKKGMSIGVFSMMVNIVLAMIGAILARNITIALYTFIFIIIRIIYSIINNIIII